MIVLHVLMWIGAPGAFAVDFVLSQLGIPVSNSAMGGLCVGFGISAVILALVLILNIC